jgi:hypothetical protein
VNNAVRTSLSENTSSVRDRRSSAETSKYDVARADASSREQIAELGRARNGRIFAVSGIRPPEVEELKAAREIVRDVRGLAIEDRTEPLIGFANARADDVLLILTRKLAARDKKIGTILANRGTRAIAEATEPDEKILLELGRFLLSQLVVSDERDVNEAECLLKDLFDFVLEDVFSGRCRVEVV